MSRPFTHRAPASTPRRALTRRLSAAGAVGATLAWHRHRATLRRDFTDAPEPTPSGGHTSASSAAHVENFVPGADPVQATSFDVGTGVAGYVWRPSAPKAVVLFQHGWGDYTERWVEQAHALITQLVAAGYAVYGFDIWGNGRSPGKRGLTNATEAVNDHLAARSAIGNGPDKHLPLFLAGHSLGGLVAVSSALETQDNLAGLILLAPAIKYDASPALLRIAQAAAFLAPTASVPGMSNSEGAAALTRDPVAARTMQDDEDLFLGAMNFTTASTGGNLARLNWTRYDQLRVPLLAIHGTADGATDPAGSEELIQQAPSADKNLHLIEGAMHSLLDDLDAAQVLQIVLDWLEDRTP